MFDTEDGMASAVDDIGASLGFDDNAKGGDGDDINNSDLGLGDGTDANNTGDSSVWDGAAEAAGKVPATKSADGNEVNAANTPATAPAAPPAPGPADMPRTWRQDIDPAKWAALDPELKSEVLKREADMFRGIEGYKADATYGKSIKGVMEPYMPILTQMGVDPVRQVDSLMRAHYMLATGSPEVKAQLFQKLAADYKVDLAALQPGEPHYIDPAVQALQQKLDRLESTQSAREQRELAVQRETLSGQINAFATDPKHTHFEAVGHDMAQLLQAGVCNTLGDAYEKAVWANPTTRALEQTRMTAAASQKATDEAVAKAEAARKATAANVRAKARNGSAAAPLGSMDDTIKETFAKIHAR